MANVAGVRTASLPLLQSSVDVGGIINTCFHHRDGPFYVFCLLTSQLAGCRVQKRKQTNEAGVGRRRGRALGPPGEVWPGLDHRQRDPPLPGLALALSVAFLFSFLLLFFF